MFKSAVFAVGILLSTLFSMPSQAQETTPLFMSNEPLNIRLSLSLKELKRNTNDSTYVDHVLYYEKESGVWDSIKVELRTRGEFRLRECYFPPIRIKIKKKVAKGTLFEGNKSLKLVVPCKKTKDANGLVLKEFMCYKIYETITPYTFSTRLVNLDFWESSGKNERNYKLTGFFLEDDDLVAKRHHAKIKKDIQLHPLTLHDTTAIRYDFFQYFIANIDWSTAFLHNAKIMQTEEPKRSIPLTYDFDQSGFVDAPYAILNPEFEMTNVKDRIYRGFCRPDNSVIMHVRDQFIGLEGKVFEIIGIYQNDLDKKEYNSLERFVSDFYKIMKNDKLFEMEILNKCRLK